MTLHVVRMAQLGKAAAASPAAVIAPDSLLISKTGLMFY